MATLKNLATSGRTVVITLEHASSEAYSILDYLLLLSHGRTIYFGEALGALDVSTTNQEGSIHLSIRTVLTALPHLTHGFIGGCCCLRLQHFAVAGFPCPALQSPPDHFMRAINPEFDKVVMTLRLGQVFPCFLLHFVVPDLLQ